MAMVISCAYTVQTLLSVWCGCGNLGLPGVGLALTYGGAAARLKRVIKESKMKRTDQTNLTSPAGIVAPYVVFSVNLPSPVRQFTQRKEKHHDQASTRLYRGMEDPRHHLRYLPEPDSP